MMGYDSHTIYQVYIKDQNNVIWVKIFYIFEDYKIKASIKILNYNEGKPTFQGFFSSDNDKKSEKLMSTYDKSKEVENIKGKQSTHIKLTNTCDNSQKFRGTKGKQLNSYIYASQEFNNEARSYTD